MLSELNQVGEWFIKEPKEAWQFDEIYFDDETKKTLAELDLDIDVFDHSARVNISGNINHCYIPGHYFLYALRIQPLVLLIREYMLVFDKVADSVSAVDFDTELNSETPNFSRAVSLDPYSYDNFVKVFKNSSDRLEAKAIINKDSKKGKKYRSPEDFSRSIILKSLPVPDASSGILAHLIHAFSLNDSIYQMLIDKYSSKVPYILSAGNSDDLVFKIMVTLGLKGKVEELVAPAMERFFAWGEFDDFFLLSRNRVAGNNQYVSTPVHYLSSKSEYVFIKKGILADSLFTQHFCNLLGSVGLDTTIEESNGNYYLKSAMRLEREEVAFQGGRNKIFYGAPGTGKSHKIHTEECDGAKKIVTVFHPETQYNDFVGALKPKMEINSEGKSEVTYQFRPGPFTNALIEAKSHPSNHVCLIIEEINRAPAAAVFGELFQLLDRDEKGQSTYKIDAADPDMLSYINSQLRLKGKKEIEQLEIPSNLSILATMNSSDQAVMPMDAAFKRRWSFQYLDINFEAKGVPNSELTLTTTNGEYEISWTKFAMIINEALVDLHVAEDRLLGPFFLTKEELRNKLTAKDTITGKLFVYLWDDVLRHVGQNRVFSSNYKTFGKLSSAFEKDMAVFSTTIEEKIEKEGQKREVDEAQQNAVE